ncbi:MAG: hypothetical protein COA71_09870 [SAR86 cluster bacterium]|uniref:Type II secretion system protein GspC N-terminal domain-containing protein n=1 Tax=SAR86 cluster bacterium TaxID=2030880 RepID=A0A2A5CBK8_9GAMM|nr:MAG: hypothetical protein COA71_09870 [SAR86 cluster bacterium]
MKNNIFNSILLLSMVFAKTSFAQEIGTLFTTPEERAYLDFLREEFLLNNQANDFDIDEVVPAVPVIDVEEDASSISTYSLGGIFTRQDGSRTVWLNENNITENNLPDNMILVNTATSSLLRIQIDTGVYDLRAGQTLDVINNQVLESWQLPRPELDNELTENNTDTNEENVQVAQLPEDNTTVIPSDVDIVGSGEELIPAEELIQLLQEFQEAQNNENLQ